MKDKIRLAIQKSSRLGEESLKIVKDAGFKIKSGNRMLKAFATNFPLEILFLRAKDIMSAVYDDIVDLGIVGQNTVYEYDTKNILEEKLKLGFGDCRLCLAIPESKNQKKYVIKKIASSHPKILEEYLKKQGKECEIVSMSGSVEIAPFLNLADAICDLVSTGETLSANGLKEIETIMESQAVLIAKKDSLKNKEIFDEFIMRISSVINAKNLTSLIMNVPKNLVQEIKDQFPSLKSPTISVLSKENWVAMHIVVKEDENFWEMIKNLKKIGARDILIYSVDRIVY